MAITWVALTNSLGISNATTLLAAAYESRATAIARLFVPTVSFAGDTAQTATDGSFNTNNTSVLRSATAVLATPTNILNAGNAAVGAANQVTAKPLIIKVRRDPFTGDVLNYGVFNADGSVPGQVARYSPGTAGDPFDPNFNPRYLVNRMRGEVYLNNNAGIAGVNLDAAPGAELTPAAVGEDNVIAIVEFKALEGAALSAAQQAASELSNVIQSLATLIRGFKDSERNLFSAIR
jgi:hypothetical protein